LIGRYYVPDDRQLRRTARHSRAYMRALSHLIARDHETVVGELRSVVEENIEDVEPYFALGALFRSRGEHERAIRVHQALALRERDKRKLRQRAMYELGLDFRAAGMPRRATRAMEEVLLEEPSHEGALRALAALYEEQARFQESAGLWQRLGKRRDEDTSLREHHLLVAAAQAALARDDQESAKQQLKAAQKLADTAHFYAAAAELAAVRGNHRGAKERLKQALVAEPALAPHVLPGLIAAEEGIDRADKPKEDELEVTPIPGPLPSPPPAAPDSVALVPTAKPTGSVNERVLATLAEIEAKTGPRLELALIRAQLGGSTQSEVARELAEKFTDALAARVIAARLALDANDSGAIRQALDVLVGDRGALAWALRGRWQCEHCGNRPGPFSWRCGQCRRWGTLRMETGVEPPPIPPRDRRAEPRSSRVKIEGLLGEAPDIALPAPTLDHGLSEDDLARGGAAKRSLLGRVGGWFGNMWRRGA
jgi:lipopolysaccharide biosynthesis regulator YciM